MKVTEYGTNLAEKALLEMLRQAEPELRERYGNDSAVQILDEGSDCRKAD